MKKQKKEAEKQKQEAQKLEPNIDEIITITKQDGRPRLEIKKTAAQAPDIGREAEPVPKVEPVKDKPKEAKQTKVAAKAQAKEANTKPVNIAKNIAKEKALSKSSAPVVAPALSGGTSCAKVDTLETKSSVGNDKLALAEAALFLSPKPLMLDELARIMGVSSLGYVKESLERLGKFYSDRGVEVVSSPSGWQMQVRPEYLGHVAHLAPYADISEGPKRALALILFKEPLKQSELIKMQGNKVYDYLRELEKIGMIKREPSGRTKLLSLTKEFERYFGEEKEKVRERLGQELADLNKEKTSAPAEAKTQQKINVEDAAKKFNINVDLRGED